MKKIFVMMILLIFGTVGLSCNKGKKPEYKHIKAKAIKADDPRISTTNVSLSLMGYSVAKTKEDAKKYAINELKQLLAYRTKPTSFAIRTKMNKNGNGKESSGSRHGGKADKTLFSKIKTTISETNSKWLSYARFDGEAGISIPNSPNVITETMVGKFSKSRADGESIHLGMHVGIKGGVCFLLDEAIRNAKGRKYGTKDGAYYGIAFLTDLSVEEIEDKFMIKCKFAIIFDEE